MFYLAEGRTDGERIPSGPEEVCAVRAAFAGESDPVSGGPFFFLSEVCGGRVAAGVVADRPEDAERGLSVFLERQGLSVRDASVREISLTDMGHLVEKAEKGGFLSGAAAERRGLPGILRRDLFKSGDRIAGNCSRKEALSRAGRYLLAGTLVPELKRVYSSVNRTGVLGHPVHYAVVSDNAAARAAACDLLVQALYASGRLRSRRYNVTELGEKPMPDAARAYEELYKAATGGTVVAEISNDYTDADMPYRMRGPGLLEDICLLARQYRNKVLTIFCLTEANRSLYKKIRVFTGLPSVELTEDLGSRTKAAEYLRGLARAAGVRADAALTDVLEGKKDFLASTLDFDFDNWFGEKLRKTIYPRYRDVLPPVTKKRPPAKPAERGRKKKSSLDVLNEMTGLSAVKKTIADTLDYYDVQKMRDERGIKHERPAMHMIFTGNPGTAKTTVARLFADIMKDRGLLETGVFVETGRADLVGQYVGSTAPRVRKKFDEARGGVLFIDEAYSLVDDREGLFGDEAINTIVQEMENHRDDTIVIFAGYPDKMEGFMNKNPGLKSRIAFHISFDDYNTDELCEIAAFIAREKGFRLSEDASAKLRRVFEAAGKKADFGNGRFVRNVLEKATMSQAARLKNADPGSLSKEALTTITAEDIETPAEEIPEPRRMGFTA